jgi:hypothetical protein
MDWLWQNPMVQMGVSAGLGALGGKLLSGRQVQTVGRLMQDLCDVLAAVVDMLSPDDDGQVRITPREAERLRNEIRDVVQWLKGNV